MLNRTVSEKRNPGTTDPVDQSYAAPDLSSGSPSGGPSTDSNGEMQIGNQHRSRVIQGTVTSERTNAPLVTFSGDGGQRKDMQPTPQAEVTGRGLPKEVFPGNGSTSRPIAAQVAEALPPTINVTPSQRPGGLPKNVMIR
jgi:hypothetical protein